MGGSLTEPGADENTGNGDPSAEWRSLCERFHEIRLGAYRHNLADGWRRLTLADPDGPGMLAGWRRLDEQIRHLDEQESQDAVRYGADGDDTGDHDSEAYSDDWEDWDGWGDEYGCPVGRCDRKVKSFLGGTPRCELFRAEMARLPAQPQG
jgi:hypothetical protein